MFETVRVDEALGTIVWENGADIDPDVLIESLVPAWLEKENRLEAAKSSAVREFPLTYAQRRKKTVNGRSWLCFQALMTRVGTIGGDNLPPVPTGECGGDKD
ncbi:MAG: DUF2442 domain-containing protein [Ignavibacteriales bacterium]|nr:DUF2442 domain-containing protein [Ignavibacteriales bacterium]